MFFMYWVVVFFKCVEYEDYYDCDIDFMLFWLKV